MVSNGGRMITVCEWCRQDSTGEGCEYCREVCKSCDAVVPFGTLKQCKFCKDWNCSKCMRLPQTCEDCIDMVVQDEERYNYPDPNRPPEPNEAEYWR